MKRSFSKELDIELGIRRALTAEVEAEKFIGTRKEFFNTTPFIDLSAQELSEFIEGDIRSIIIKTLTANDGNYLCYKNVEPLIRIHSYMSEVCNKLCSPLEHFKHRYGSDKLTPLAKESEMLRDAALKALGTE